MSTLLKDAKNFIEGYGNYLTKDSLPPFVQEQIQLRAYLCQSCLISKKCDKCGCKTPAMFYAPNKQDSRQRWAEFLSETQWTALKNNIDQYKCFLNELKRGEIRGLQEIPYVSVDSLDSIHTHTQRSETLRGGSLAGQDRGERSDTLPEVSQ